MWEARRLLSETIAERANQMPPRCGRGCVGLPENGDELSVQEVLHVASLSGSWTLLVDVLLLTRPFYVISDVGRGVRALGLGAQVAPCGGLGLDGTIPAKLPL